MISQGLKLKSRIFTLPKSWAGKEIFVQKTEDTIVIKKIEDEGFWNIWRKMKRGSKGIKNKEIEKAILWARKAKRK